MQPTTAVQQRHAAKLTHWKAVGVQVVVTTATGAMIGAPWLYPQFYWFGTLGLACLLVIASRERPMAAAGQSFLIGAIALSMAFHWSWRSIFDTTNLSMVQSGVVFLLLIGWVAIEFALLGTAVSILSRRSRSWIWTVVPIWVAIESYWPQVFSWSFAHTYLEFLPIIQVAEFAGTAGVSACVMFASVSIARAWLHHDRRQDWIEVGAAVALLLVVCGWGTWRVSIWQSKIASADRLNIAAVQVNPTHVSSIDRMRELSDSVAEKVDLYVWPESSLGHYDVALRDFCDELCTVENSEAPNPALDPYPNNSAQLLAGGKTYEVGGRNRGPYKNTAFLIDSSKRIAARYVKRTLMPIGEYVPGESIFPKLRDWAAVDAELLPGTDNHPMRLKDGQKIGVLVCYEDMVAENSSSTVREGAQCLVALINGSAFTDPDTLRQHLQLARLRAVENRRSLVRCAATGVTCVIHPDGRIARQLPIQGDGVLYASVPLANELTFFTRHGHWFAPLAITVTTLLLLPSQWLGWKRASGQGELQ